MFTTINKPYRPWPTVWGLGVVAGALGLVFGFQAFWLQVLNLQPPEITAFQVIPLTNPPKLVAVAARARKERLADAAKVAEKNAGNPTASAMPGTLQWRQHVERGHNLDYEIVAEESLPWLRASGVPLAMDVHRPRGRTLLYNLLSRNLSHGVVADDVVVREIEGLPAEFDGPLREAEREFGSRPRVWALYSADLYSVLRSLTEDALHQQAVPMDSVRTARVRLSLTGGAVVVRLVSHS